MSVTDFCLIVLDGTEVNGERQVSIYGTPDTVE